MLNFMTVGYFLLPLGEDFPSSLFYFGTSFLGSMALFNGPTMGSCFFSFQGDVDGARQDSFELLEAASQVLFPTSKLLRSNEEVPLGCELGLKTLPDERSLPLGKRGCAQYIPAEHHSRTPFVYVLPARPSGTGRLELNLARQNAAHEFVLKHDLF